MIIDELTPRPEDVSAEAYIPPRMGVVVCDCGKQIAGPINTEALCAQAADLPGVVYVHHEGYPCSKDGRLRLGDAIREHQLERVIVAGCSPRLVRPMFRETAVAAGLDRSCLNMTNIREQVAYLYRDSPETALQVASGAVEMAAARLGSTSIAPPRSGRILPSALVIGVDFGSLIVSTALAEAGYHVTLVDRSDISGGIAPEHLDRQARLQVAAKLQEVIQHPHIDSYFNAQVVEVTGHPGEYEITVQQGDRVHHLVVGAVVAANAAHPKSLGDDQWFDRSRVKTQTEFESELDRANEARIPLALNNIVFIFCAEPSQREKCTRACCNVGLRQAIQAKKLNPNANITILFRDLYLGGIGEGYEAELIEARKLGITLFRYRTDRPPVIGSQTVDILDTLTGEPVRVPFDRVVLSMPLVPLENTPKLASLLGLPLDDEGFMAEPRLRLRPGRYAERGIFALGSAQQPIDTNEALFQAYLVSSRVARFLEQDTITIENPSAYIDPALCTGCGNCPQVCPAKAIHLEKTDGVLSRSEVDTMRCYGCGNCVVVCPTKAITLPGWDNIEIPVQIEAALQSRSFQAGLPKVIVLACEWSAYAAADVAGKRVKGGGPDAHAYPANVRILRMNCSARFDPYHILWAFLNGADGVYLGACPPGECHYGSGNLYARERVELLRNNLAQHHFDPRRLRLEFMSVDDGPKFARSLTEFVKQIAELDQ